MLQQSGSPSKLPNVLDMQRYFDDLVNATNCTDAKDRLGCLRGVPYSQLIQAVNREPNLFSYQSLNLVWQPMIDGILIPRNPLQILQSGEYARVSTRIPQGGLFLRFHRFLLSQAIAKTRGRKFSSLTTMSATGFTCHSISMFTFPLRNITWVVGNNTINF